jgi:Uma2 family endonuclease
MTAELTRVRFSVADYHRMIEVGILDEDDRVELIDGEIVSMSAVGSLHAGTVNRLSDFLFRALSGRAVIAVQNPVQLSDDTEPEPDLAVLLPRDDFYTTAHPLPADVFLLMEVGDSSFLADRQAKIPRYARAGIRESWLVNLEGGVIERYTDPGPNGYREIATLARGQRLASAVIAGLTLDGDQILGPTQRPTRLPGD